MTKGGAFSIHSSITPTMGIVADHTAYFLKQDWIGRTHIQVMNTKTGKTGFLKKETRESAWWFDVLFPRAATSQYPMDFKIKDADRTFILERKIIGTCDGGFTS
jgi:hypothetical protein